MKVELGDAVNQVRQQKEEAEDRRGGADPPEQPEIAQDGGLLVLVHSAGRHLSRLLYGQSGGRGPLPLEQLHQRDLQGLGQGLQQLQVGKSPSCLPF